MRIGIDATRIGSVRTGIETFTLTVLQTLPILLANHPDWHISVFATDDGIATIRSLVSTQSGDQLALLRVPSGGGGWLREQLLLPLAGRNLGALPLFYSPGYPVSPLLLAQRILLQVHDMVPWRYGHTMTPGSQLYWRAMLPWSVRRAYQVLVDSRFTRDELMQYSFARAKRVSVLHLAIDDRYLRFEDHRNTGRMLGMLGIKRPYLLALGSLEPRKNLMFLLDVFEAYMKTGQSPEMRLVIAGGRGWRNKPFHAKVASHPYRKRIILPGWIDADRMIYLLAGAHALLYPSLYEGFGLPPVEALALGTPAVVSNAASMPEVMGEHALYADVDASEQWVKQIQLAVADGDYRRRIAVEGPSWAHRYSQASLAVRLGAVFEAALD